MSVFNTAKRPLFKIIKTETSENGSVTHSRIEIKKKTPIGYWREMEVENLSELVELRDTINLYLI